MKSLLFLPLFALPLVSVAQIRVDDFIPAGAKDHTKAIQLAFDKIDSIGHGSIEFTGTQTYIVNATLELPKAKTGGRRIIVINGNGAMIKSSKPITFFKRIPTSQDEALNKFISTRFVIRDLQFTGGQKAIHIGATYGTVIENCNFIGQDSTAVDIQFGLNTSLNQCIVTNPGWDAFVLRCGESWGGNAINSQSNHSVLNQCRVYSSKGGNSAFKILGSSGVVLRDIISEGSNECNYAIYFDRLKSTTVRLFTIENFHFEHAPSKAGIYLNHTGIATIDGLYYQMARDDFKLIEAAPGAEQITLRNVPHFVTRTIVYSGNNEVPWRVEFCHKSFYDKANWRVGTKDGPKTQLPFYFSGVGGKYQIKKEIKEKE